MVAKIVGLKIKCSPHRQWEFAKLVNVNPSTLSNWLNNVVKVRHGDERIVRIGKALGLTAAECFEDDPDRYELRDHAPLEMDR